MTSPYWKVMNDLSETITSYLIVRDILRDSNYEPKLIDAALTLLEHYVDVQDRTFTEAWNEIVRSSKENIQDMKHDALYSDDPAYTENDKEQIYKNYRAAIDEYNKLQDLYNQCQSNYRSVVSSLKQVTEERMELEHQLDEVKEYDC
jgi:hypothetical protein